MKPGDDRPAAAFIGKAIFLSRWLQAPLYIGLIIAQAVYVWQFMRELKHLIWDMGHLGETEIMLTVLGLVDVVMIANLLIMVIIGGYETFVSKLDLENHPDQPEWLSSVNANLLKVKLGMAIVGISSIHLLKTFIEAGAPDLRLSNDQIMWQVLIHLTFVVSAIALAWIDRIGAGSKMVEKQAKMLGRKPQSQPQPEPQAAPAAGGSN